MSFLTHISPCRPPNLTPNTSEYTTSHHLNSSLLFIPSSLLLFVSSFRPLFPLLGVISGTLCFQELVALYKYHLDDPLSSTSSHKNDQEGTTDSHTRGRGSGRSDHNQSRGSHSPSRSTSNSQSQSFSQSRNQGFQGKSHQVGEGIGGEGVARDGGGGKDGSEGGVYRSPTRQKHQQQQQARRGNEGRLQLVGMGEGWR